MPVPKKMKGVLLTGFGGFDKLNFRDDLPVPVPAAGEVLIKVGACGMNNTDLWTREGAYGNALSDESQSGWRDKEFDFPRIQGADIVGVAGSTDHGLGDDWEQCAGAGATPNFDPATRTSGTAEF